MFVDAFSKPENNDPYIGKWVGVSSNKKSKEDRDEKDLTGGIIPTIMF